MTPTGDTGRYRPLVIEYFVSNRRMNVVRCHRWEADYSAGEVLCILREWTWNYLRGRYTENRYTFAAELTDSGTVVHDGRSLGEYAETRVGILSQKRGLRDATIVRTEHIAEAAGSVDETSEQLGGVDG